MINQIHSLLSAFTTWTGLSMNYSIHGFVRFIRENGLSLSQISTLFQLYHCGTSAVSQISSNLDISNAAASQLLERLVQQGLITRSENPLDRREKQLVLTNKGYELLRDSAKACSAWQEKLISTLTPEEQNKVSEALEILIDKTKQLPNA